MRPHIHMHVEPVKGSDLSEVVMSVSATTPDGGDHWIRLYEQLRYVQELPEEMHVEVWACAVFAEMTEAIRAALSALVNNGQGTLMQDTWEQQKL